MSFDTDPDESTLTRDRSIPVFQRPLTLDVNF